MAQTRKVDGMKNRKRPRPGEDDSASCGMPLDEFNQDLIEMILSRLPASSFFRLRSVCKRWRSVASSPTFHSSCSDVSFREPWFLMVDPDLGKSIVFDISEGNWKDITYPGNPMRSIPVASAGGLVCYLTASGGFTICNPVTGTRRLLPPAGAVDIDGNGKTHAIAMSSSPYKLLLVSGEFPNLSVSTYDSRGERWEEEAVLRWKPTDPVEWGIPVHHEIVYFLSKGGDVVATNMQRSPFKQYSSVLTVEEGGEEHLYFLSPTGAVVACNLAQRSFREYPRLLPIDLEHSIDVVSCRGEMMVVILSEFLESASLRLWRFCRQGQQWHQVAAMPPSLSHEFYGKKADINCVGFMDMVFICVSSSELATRYVIYSLASGRWSELPRCSVKGTARGFMSAFAFEPRVESRV